MKTLYLVDASVYIFRAYYSLPPEMADADGNPTNAVYGFTGMLATLLEQAQPSHIAVAFDESLESSFRNDIYPAYKANRDPAPIELRRQFQHCRALTEALGIECFSHHRYEADDFIGTLAHLHADDFEQTVVVTADKDLAQVLREGDLLWDFAKSQKLKWADVEEKFGVKPSQIIDYLALTGDSVDNIPGVPGIGPKSAAALLSHFGTLDAIYERVEEVPFLSVRGAKSLHKKLRAHESDARLARQLTEIALDAPVGEPPPALAWQTPDSQSIEQLFDFLGFGRMLRQRCLKLQPNINA